MLGLRARARCVYGIIVNHIGKVIVFPNSNLLNFVRGAETVEEVEEGDSGLNCGKVRHGAEVHNLLSVRFCKHGKAGLTASHYVGVVTENRECVAGKCSGRNMEDAGEKPTCNLIHVWNHEQQALGGRVVVVRAPAFKEP